MTCVIRLTPSQILNPQNTLDVLRDAIEVVLIAVNAIRDVERIRL